MTPVKRARLWGWALIAAVALAAYLPTLRNGFIWDDDGFLLDNPLIKASDGLSRFWFTGQAPDYWPVTSSTLWVEWRLWGREAAGYHATNLILHIVEAGLIWTLLRRMRVPGALFAALVFAVHPVNVESVAWIAQRKNLMAMLFYLLALYAFLEAVPAWGGKSQREPRSPGPESPPEGRPFGRPIPEGGEEARYGSSALPSPQPATPAIQLNGWYWVSLGAFVLAMLGKGSVAPLPLVLLGLIAWKRKVRWGDLARLAPFFAVAGALTVVNLVFKAHTTTEIVRTAGPLERLLGAAGVVWFYLGKALWPANLIFVYPQWRIDAANPLWWLPLLGVAAVSGYLLRRARRKGGWARPALFAWGYYLVMLIPVMGFTDVFFMKYSLVADHYQHLALIGVAAAAGAAWDRCLAGQAKPVLGAAVIAILGLLTWRQCGIYRDNETLYRSILARNPNAWLAHNNLVNILTATGRVPEAVAHLREALRLRPGDARNENNLGVALVSLGRPAEAILHYEKAVRMEPGSFEFNFNLGLALRQVGRSAEAVDRLRAAVRLRPDFAPGHLALALALWDAGLRDEAAAEHAAGMRLEGAR